MPYAPPVPRQEQCSEQCTDCCSSRVEPDWMESQCKLKYVASSGRMGCEDPYFGGTAGCCFIAQGDRCAPCAEDRSEADCRSVANTCAAR
jgi:hypothetical protein